MRPLIINQIVPPDDPVIDGGPEVLLNAGESYNLSCVSRGAKPPSVIEWLKDGLPVEGANSITEVLPDRKRVTTRSFLPIQPVDTDTGRNYSCTATNLAVPTGKSTTVTLNVHHPPIVTLSIEPRSCPGRGQSHLHLPGSCQPSDNGWAKGGVVLQGARESVFTTKADHSFFTEPVSCLVFNAVGKTNVSILVWAWTENVQERYTVEKSKPSTEGGGVLSTLTINNVMESDFLSTYNCTAWNSFGPGTMIITLEAMDEVPVGIIAAGTVGSTIILFIFLLVLVLIFYRQRKGSRRGVTLGKPDIKVETINKETHSLEEDSGSVSTASRMVKAMYSPFKDEIELKTDLRSDTLDTRQEYDLK
ncbi:hypothetical protein fugu_001677, partial [Takifugu bimaculatus]